MSPSHEQVQEKQIARLEEALADLTAEVKAMNLTLGNYMASQSVKCANNSTLLVRHDTALMGDGVSREGLGTKVASLSLQVKLIMGVLGTVSTATFGITIHLLMKGLGG